MKSILITLTLLLFIACSSQYTLTDFSGRRVLLEDVTIGESNELFAVIGSTEITIPLSTIKSISIDATYKRVHKGRVLYKSQITFLEEMNPEVLDTTTQDSTAQMDTDIYIEVSPMVIGATDVGAIKLPLKSVRTLTLYEEKGEGASAPETDIPAEAVKSETPAPESETTTPPTPATP